MSTGTFAALALIGCLVAGLGWWLEIRHAESMRRQRNAAYNELLLQHERVHYQDYAHRPSNDFSGATE